MIKKIVPSKPFEKYEDIGVIASRYVNKVERIQVDICDGKFVKSLSWPLTEYSISDFQGLNKKPDLDVFMPRWEDVDYTADLMVQDPEKYIDSLVQYGFDEIIIHTRSLENSKVSFEDILSKAENYFLKVYLAIDTKTDKSIFFELLGNNLSRLEGVQVMGIDNIGFQGQELSQKSLEIVKEIKGKFPEITVMFDGAINDETIEDIRDAGVDVFCVGSFLTKIDSGKDELQYLKRVIE